MAWIALLFVATALGACNDTQILRASHQWPDGDVRGELLEIIRTELEAENVGIEMRI